MWMQSAGQPIAPTGLKTQSNRHWRKQNDEKKEATDSDLDPCRDPDPVFPLPALRLQRRLRGAKRFILEARNGPKIGLDLDPFCCIALCPVWIHNSVRPLLLRLCMCVRQSRRLDFCSPQSYCEEAKKADETYAEGAFPRSDLYEICGTLRHRAALLLGHIQQNPRSEPPGRSFHCSMRGIFHWAVTR